MFLSLSYFLIPTIYNKDLIQSQIKNQIYKKYKINIKFNNKINYGLLPKPHFVTKDLSLMRDEKEIGVVKNFKIFISITNFLNMNKIVTKDLVLKKADFNIQKNDYIFFDSLLKIEPNENKIIIKNSAIFYKDKENELLFINKIFDSEFFYDSNKLQNVFSSKNEIFNVPFKMRLENDKFNKKFSSQFSSKKIRLNIDNEFEYDDNKNGLLNISFVNNSTAINYQFKKNLINFKSKSSKNKFGGVIEIKPFYFFANFNYDGISSRNLFNDESLIVDLIKSEIFKNENLNANFTI